MNLQAFSLRLFSANHLVSHSSYSKMIMRTIWLNEFQLLPTTLLIIINTMITDIVKVSLWHHADIPFMLWVKRETQLHYSQPLSISFHSAGFVTGKKCFDFFVVVVVFFICLLWNDNIKLRVKWLKSAEVFTFKHVHKFMQFTTISWMVIVIFHLPVEPISSA